MADKTIADAIYQNIDILRSRTPDHIVILAGDHIYKMDYGAMLADHVEQGAETPICHIFQPRATPTC
jgi:glucose-1-phosphate adenylyltransferase